MLNVKNINTAKPLFFISVFISLIFISSAAKACISPILEPTADIAPYLSSKVDNPHLMKKRDEFLRDKKYYDELILDFCDVWMPLPDKQQSINEKLKELLLEKWTE